MEKECKNYNEIIDLVNQLVKLASKGYEGYAIELRDMIWDKFTKNYSEPLSKYLEMELACPPDVIFKAVRDGVYYTYSKSLFSGCKFQKLNVRLEYKYKGYVLAPVHKANFSLCLEGYKKKWFLKEDRSE